MFGATLMGLVVFLFASAASVFAQPNWCASVDKAQVGALLGGPTPAPIETGPAKDADAGGITTMCLFMQGKKGVMTMRIEFPSPQEAAKKVTLEYLKNQQGDETKYVEEKGVGDRAFWAVSDEGASYVVLKGAKLYSVALGGLDGKLAAAQKPAIAKLTLSLVGS